MSLTDNDLAAIQGVVDLSINKHVPTIVKKIVKPMFEDLEQSINAAFTDTQEQINEISQIVKRIERVQQSELERNDRQDKAIAKMRKALHAA